MRGADALNQTLVASARKEMVVTPSAVCAGLSAIFLVS
jgi:hypothetical protein